jgi:hypothetical protein
MGWKSDGKPGLLVPGLADALKEIKTDADKTRSLLDRVTEALPEVL